VNVNTGEITQAPVPSHVRRDEVKDPVNDADVRDRLPGDFDLRVKCQPWHVELSSCDFDGCDEEKGDDYSVSGLFVPRDDGIGVVNLFKEIWRRTDDPVCLVV
jgi:hypothetical protein